MYAPLRRPVLPLLIWLLLALLPLRGWANLMMHPLEQAPATVEAPCHGTSAAEPGHAGADKALAANCALCDLCHGVMALPGGLPLASEVPVRAWVNLKPLPPPGTAPAELFRPPRS